MVLPLLLLLLPQIRKSKMYDGIDESSNPWYRRKIE